MRDGDMNDGHERVAIVGAGPAGLTAAFEIFKLGQPFEVSVFEAGEIVGGIARTESYKGFRFDIGGHRFFTKVPEVEAMWHEVLGDDFITVPRLSRIFYRGRYYDYPLKIFNALRNIGPVEATRIMLSYAGSQVKRGRDEKSFEDWVVNRFGRRLYSHFFESYTQKVWGIPPSQIQADWAAQRIKNLSLSKAVWNALGAANDTTSLIEEFQYPRLGPGMMWEKVARTVEEKGGSVEMRSKVTRVSWRGDRIVSIDVCGPSGVTTTVGLDHLVNTMALRDLIECLDPPPPPHVRKAAAMLKYRDFLIVTLVLDHPDPFPDNWIYIHSPEVSVGRIQNFRAWSSAMVPAADRSSIGMEYFCHEGDDLWEASDEDLRRRAAGELQVLGLASADSVVDSAVIRQRKAYPVYDECYRHAVETLRTWLGSLTNFQTVGRNGLHRYNNQDHSMLTAMFAARNLVAREKKDVWSVNLERSYHEEFVVPEKEPASDAA